MLDRLEDATVHTVQVEPLQRLLVMQRPVSGTCVWAVWCAKQKGRRTEHSQEIWLWSCLGPGPVRESCGEPRGFIMAGDGMMGNLELHGLLLYVAFLSIAWPRHRKRAKRRPAGTSREVLRSHVQPRKEAGLELLARPRPGAAWASDCQRQTPLNWARRCFRELELELKRPSRPAVYVQSLVS